MITASIIFFNTDTKYINTILPCAINSVIDRIYIIDNSAEDRIRHIVEPMSDKIEYIHGQGNVGYGAGHNIALAKSLNLGADYHVVLNPDIEFKQGTIEALASFADSHSDIGMLMPNVVYPDGRQQYLCKLLPTPMDMFGRRLLPKAIFDRRNARFEMRKTNYDTTRNCPLLSGCFMFLRMSVIREIGMFDERYFMYFEDTDLMRRLHRVSKTVFYPEQTIIHNHAAEHRHNSKLLKISIRSAIKYFNKWGWIFDKERRNVNRHAFDRKHIITA